MLAYREFVEGVQKKSVNSLLLVVNKLINDFDNPDGKLFNYIIIAIVTFDQLKDEKKHNALKRLASLIN